jgi:hypothetical protein
MIQSVSVSFQALSHNAARATPELSAGANFRKVQQALRSVENETGNSIFTEVAAIQKRILDGKKLSTQELLVYQIKANQFGLHVELVSKVAESSLSTLKRLQSPQ